MGKKCFISIIVKVYVNFNVCWCYWIVKNKHKQSQSPSYDWEFKTTAINRALFEKTRPIHLPLKG
jgi:hypothetical protein